VAKELGVDEGSIQIGVANSLASSKEIQPYNRFSRLRKVAAILRDTGGVYMNALAQVISEFASSTVPPTEEQMAAIANAISSNAGANNQYALAGQYLDALAEYVSILRELGFSGDAAVQLAMNNYIQNLTEGQTGVAAFMTARLAAMGGS
jgi:hydrogenase maturation factor HypF (carbamoyltransferase family)